MAAFGNDVSHKVDPETQKLLDTIATLSAEVERLTEELSDARASIAAMESVQSDALDRATDRIIASQAAISAGTKGPEGSA